MTENNLEQRITAIENDNAALREIVLGTLQITAQNASAIATLTAEMREMRSAMQIAQAESRQIRTEMREMQAEMREMQSEIRGIQAEIRGIQVENQRIINYFFGEDGSEN